MRNRDRHRAPGWTSGLAEPLRWDTRHRRTLQTVLNSTGNILMPEAVSHGSRAFLEFEDMDGGLHGSKNQGHFYVSGGAILGTYQPTIVDEAIEGSK
jgi:hypothetical protein